MRKLIAKSREKTIFFKSIREAAMYFGMQLQSVTHYIDKELTIKGFKIISVDGKGKDIVDKGIDGEGTHVSYKRRGLECVTPCPFLESPKPKVGSSGCMRCKHFKGKDREKRIVRCTHKL